ncbi:MAG: YrrC family ATP-dependent DNA helicase [Cyanobacteriota bacterium]
MQLRRLADWVGYFPQIQPGPTPKLRGSWKEHLQYGSQFSADRFQETQPATLNGMAKYLGSGLIKGVDVKRIVQHFSLETLQLIKQQISHLWEVPEILTGYNASNRLGKNENLLKIS